MVLFSIFYSLNLRNYIFQSAKFEITSFHITSLHVDLNEAAKCVDIKGDLKRIFYRCKLMAVSNDMEFCLNFFDISLSLQVIH